MNSKKNISTKSLSNITHRLRTSIEIIIGNTKGIENYLPALIDGYNKARDAELPVTPIKKEHLAILADVFNDIVAEAEILIDVAESLDKDAQSRK